MSQSGDSRARRSPLRFRTALIAPLVACDITLATGHARAQPHAIVDVGLETSVERVTYHFDNPSTYNTADRRRASLVAVRKSEAMDRTVAVPSDGRRYSTWCRPSNSSSP